MAKPVTTNSVTDMQIVWQTASPANPALNTPIATAITLPSPATLLRAARSRLPARAITQHPAFESRGPGCC